MLANATGTTNGSGASGTRPSEKQSTTLVLNVGSGVFATREELGRDMRMLLDRHDRRR